MARANVLALENGALSGAYNVGTGVETSVNRLFETLLAIFGKDLPPEHRPAKPGEQLARHDPGEQLSAHAMAFFGRYRFCDNLRRVV